MCKAFEKNTRLIFFILLFLVCFTEVKAQELKEPYKGIEVQEYIAGPKWLFSNQNKLKKIMKKNKIKTIIEVGSFIGSSTQFLAENLSSSGKVYAVDNWEWIGSEEFQFFVSDPYRQFLSNIIHAGVSNKVIPCKGDSIELSKTLKVKADLIYIDASHGEEDVCGDIMAWYPHLNSHGIICGDDWNWSSVQLGVAKAAQKLGKTVHGSKRFWYID